MKRADEERLRDILDSITVILRETPKTRELFDASHVMRRFVQKELEIIGEAASKLEATTKSRAPGIPWRSVVTMRNRLVRLRRRGLGHRLGGRAEGTRAFAHGDRKTGSQLNGRDLFNSPPSPCACAGSRRGSFSAGGGSSAWLRRIRRGRCIRANAQGSSSAAARG